MLFTTLLLLLVNSNLTQHGCLDLLHSSEYHSRGAYLRRFRKFFRIDGQYVGKFGRITTMIEPRKDACINQKYSPLWSLEHAFPSECSVHNCFTDVVVLFLLCYPRPYHTGTDDQITRHLSVAPQAVHYTNLVHENWYQI